MGDEDLCQLPADFDWGMYLRYHPEIWDRGAIDSSQTKDHYCTEGRRKGLLYKKIDVIMRYTACTGRTMASPTSIYKPSPSQEQEIVPKAYTAILPLPHESPKAAGCSLQDAIKSVDGKGSCRPCSLEAVYPLPL